MIDNYEGNEPFVFVSYSHKDTNYIAKVIHALSGNGFRVWNDTGIEIGREWPENIADHLMRCSCMLCFLSRNYAESDYCRRELTFCLNKQKPILCVYLEDFEISAGLQLQLGMVQVLHYDDTRTLESLIDKLSTSKILESCRKATEQISTCDNGNTERDTTGEKSAFKKPKEKKNAKKTKKITRIAVATACAIIAFAAVLFTILIPYKNYNTAMALMAIGDYDAAIAAFERLGDYKDSAMKLKQCKYNKASVLMETEEYMDAMQIFRQLGDCADSAEKIMMIWDKVAFREVVSISGSRMTCLSTNGTVTAMNADGDEIPNQWTDMIAVSAGDSHIVGLRADGIVAAMGDDMYNQCDVAHWRNIVAISAGGDFTIGLQSDGRVVATALGIKASTPNERVEHFAKYNYGQCDVENWTNIIAISAGSYHTVALKSDGTVVAAGNNDYGQCEVKNWTDIVAIYAGGNHTVGLTADGRVVAVGDNLYQQCDVDGWMDIVAVSAGYYHTVGLKSDGTVVATPIETATCANENYNQCRVEGWTDIVAIVAGGWNTVGLKSDGTLVATGADYSGAVANWISAVKDIKRPD